jgi:hypothetical protein
MALADVKKEITDEDIMRLSGSTSAEASAEGGAKVSDVAV